MSESIAIFDIHAYHRQCLRKRLSRSHVARNSDVPNAIALLLFQSFVMTAIRHHLHKDNTSNTSTLQRCLDIALKVFHL